MLQVQAASTAAVVLALVVVNALGESPLWCAPVIVVAAFMMAGVARSSLGELRGELSELESARDLAVADATNKAQFLANMSHEIRTPMNGILGMAELLVQTELDTDQEQMATTIQSSADALLAVLNDILDFSKIEAGKVELESVDFDVWQLVDECAGLLHSLADDKGVELLTYVDPRVARCHRADSARIRQVLMNFLSNAVKFTIEGEVVVGVDFVDDAGRDPAVETLRFWVRDSGVGIKKEAIDRLFRPFSQADASTTRRFGGTGLGLVICRRLVDMMGGDIHVESVVGDGSVFSFTLALPKGESTHARPRAEDVDLIGQSLLVVDGNDTSRKLVAMQMSPSGVGVDDAGNAISAMQKLRKAAERGEPFTMAVVDLAMPGIDGLQLARAVRNDPAIPGIAIVLTSSMGARPSLAELAEVDIFRWLAKPLACGRVLQAVTDMASLRKPRVHVGEGEADGDGRGGSEAAGATTALQELQLGSTQHVLVAEDNEINRRVVGGMLKRIGCHVTFAMDGREALQLVEHRDFELVLMDCQMPEMDGFEATRAIRALGDDYAELPILALTANVMAEDREACLAAGMNDFLSKPVKLDMLRVAVERWGTRVEQQARAAE